MGFFSKAKKAVRKVGAAHAGVASGLTLGLVKPKVFGVKSESNTHLANTVARGTKVAAAVATVGVAGAGVAGAGPLAGLSKFFSGGTPSVPLSASGIPTGAPGEPEGLFGSIFNQRLETLGQVDPSGGFGGEIPVSRSAGIGGILQNKMVLMGLGVAVLLAGILVFRRK